MNAYEWKQQRRRERLEARAARLAAESDAAYKRSTAMASVIPMGQPIMIGHHSEGRDRRYRAKIHAAMDRSCALATAAAKVAERAAAVGTGGISSDDPEAVRKLVEELAALEATQDRMKRCNPIVRAFYKAGVRDATSGDLWARYLVKLREVLPEASDGRAMRLLQPDFAGRIGFADFELKNNGANIRRIKGRIEELRAAAASAVTAERKVGDVTVREDAEENRIMLIFPGKPPEATRALLKRCGFRWSPTNGAWQRMLNNAGRSNAEYVLRQLAGVPA